MGDPNSLPIYAMYSVTFILFFSYCVLNVRLILIFIVKSYLFSVSAAAPTTATSHTANICVANISHFDALYDPTNCYRLSNIKEAATQHIRADQIVFAIRFPHRGLSMSRWFQFVATSIRLDIEYDPANPYKKKG